MPVATTVIILYCRSFLARVLILIKKRWAIAIEVRRRRRYHSLVGTIT